MFAFKTKWFVSALFLFNVWLPSFSHASEPQTVEVVKNVFVMTHGGGIDSNTTFVITAEGVVVIDTRVTPGEARKVVEEIRKHTDLPIKFTINTHYHGDHTFGNQVFRESGAIIAHKNVFNALNSQKGLEHLNKFKTFNIPGIDEVKITPPNVLYENSMGLYLGGFYMELIYVGRGHTDGDTVILFPDLRLLIAGDMIFNGKNPYMGDAYIDEWIQSLFKMEDMRAEMLVPGHGDPGGRPMLIQMRQYLVILKEQVTRQIEAGKTLEEIQSIVRPIIQEKYPTWLNPDWINDNIKRAYMEFKLADKGIKSKT